MTVNRLVAFVTMAAFAFGGASMAVADDLVDTAVKAGTFKTLAAALGAAELVDTLKGKGPFTVLAPLRISSSPRTKRSSRRSCCSTSSRAP